MPPPYRDIQTNESIWSALGPYFIVFFIGVCFVLFGYTRSKTFWFSWAQPHSIILSGPEYLEHESEKLQKS